MSWHYNWTNQSNALSSSEMYDNASEIWDILKHDYGWTDEAAAAVIANFQSEGALNPCQWQYGSTIGAWDSGSTGLGLGQWTPPRKLANYMGGADEAHIANGAKQVIFTVEKPEQWVQRVNRNGYSSYYGTGGIPYITSISQFGNSSYPPEDMAICWAACWEGPSKSGFQSSYSIRRSRARHWFNEFSGGGGEYRVNVDITGNGTVTVIPRTANAGESVMLECLPNGEDILLDIYATDSQGQAFALQVWELQYFTMPASNLLIRVTFTGETPIPPEPPTPVFDRNERKHMPIWMYPSMRNRRRTAW